MTHPFVPPPVRPARRSRPAAPPTCDRLATDRAVLDLVPAPLGVFDACGRPALRNPALVRLLDAEPERARVEAALGRLARGLGASSESEADGAVETARGRYGLRGRRLATGLLGPDAACVVAVVHEPAREVLGVSEVRRRHGLTARQAEVALLLAEGLPNDALAERLFIAPTTARRHTEGVLRKLDVATRASVAARLYRPG